MVFAVFFLFHVKLVVFTRNFYFFVVIFARYVAFFLFRLVFLGLFFGIKWILLRFCF